MVVTSISSPNQVLQVLARGCVKHGWDFIVAGDILSPKNFQLDGCAYYDIDRQMGTDFLVSRKCLTGHYARKNVGYLIAIKKGADIIVETDDDNLPQESFWQQRKQVREARFINGKGWVNVYSYFSDDFIWPRGFPLNLIRKKTDIRQELLSLRKLKCPIQQGLANNNPDVDAVYRLVMPLPINFKGSDDIALGPQVWSPFNSQNTTWWPEAFPLLYLPSYCSFRMTDIYRSLVAQRIAWENGWSVLFHRPTVSQERNQHNLMKDFADEMSGYIQVETIGQILEQINIKPGVKLIPDAMRQCYGRLVAKSIFDVKELDVLEAWLKDLDGLSLDLCPEATD